VPRPKRWVFEDQNQSVWEVRLHSWKYFSDFIREHAEIFAQNAIFRGHADATWRLEPSLDRVLRAAGKLTDAKVRANHLRAFQLAARGRRGDGRQVPNDDEWWALGQHHGLATPLLDWTRSPFVALYFAYQELASTGDSKRAVWMLNLPGAENLNDRIRAATKDSGADPITQRLIEPLSDDNARLVNQGGLFTRGPDGVPVDDWVRQHVIDGEGRIVLAKITIPRLGREACLRYLNAMNINHRSLFPDLVGASVFCNMQMLVKNY
jgi:hypothetical protein